MSYPNISQKDNPALPDEPPRRPEADVGVDPERPDELVDILDDVERQDITAPGAQAELREADRGSRSG